MKSSPKLTEEQVNPYFEKWEFLSAEIKALHKERKKGVAEPTKEGIHLFEHLLVHCDEADQEKPLRPLNGEERLVFIKQFPGSFAAFRQLDELFVEMKKKIAVRRIQLKR